mmetsp:Transcript_10618/g.31937  ORF Transcript_10618/g.31937 Transcript_10618/m.31937 type:complete len:297 (+) Transcript_10618:150-1040(+)
MMRTARSATNHKRKEEERRPPHHVRCSSEAHADGGGVGGDLEFVGPAGAGLGVEVEEDVGEFLGVVELAEGPGAGVGGMDDAVDDDVGAVDAERGVLVAEALREAAECKLDGGHEGEALAAAEGHGGAGNEKGAALAGDHVRQHLPRDAEAARDADVEALLEVLRRHVRDRRQLREVEALRKARRHVEDHALHDAKGLGRVERSFHGRVVGDVARDALGDAAGLAHFRRDGLQNGHAPTHQHDAVLLREHQRQSAAEAPPRRRRHVFCAAVLVVLTPCPTDHRHRKRSLRGHPSVF